MSASMSTLAEDLLDSSPVTLVLIAVVGGAVAYVALRQAWRACKLVWQFVAMRRTKQSQDNKSPAPSASETEASSRRKSGKSIKALLKQQKKAQQRPQHEQVPESDFFLNSLKGHGGTVVSVDISPGDTHIMTACTDQVVRIYNMKGDFAAPAPSLRRLPLSGVPLGAAFWGDDSTAGACIEGVGEVAAMVTAAVPPGQNRVAETTLLSAIHGAAPATAVCAAATSGGGRPVMATMTAKNKVAVMLGGGKKVAEVEPNGIENYQIALSRDGRFLAATTFASDVKLWHLEFDRQKAFRSCAKAMELKGHSAGVHSIAFNTDATRAVTASKDHTLRVWKLDVRYCQQEDPKCLRTAKLEGAPYAHLAWCSNDMIVGATGHELHFISSATGKVCERIKDAHAQPIRGLVASRDAVKCGEVTESVVVSCAADSNARVWVVPAM